MLAVRVRGIGHLRITSLFDFVCKLLCYSTQPLLCGMNGYSFRLRQKLSSIPLTRYKQQRPKHVRVSVG
jgi:hypothetical protein